MDRYSGALYEGIELYDDLSILEAISKTVPLSVRLGNRFSRMRVVVWVVRRFRPGWRNRGWREAQVRQFNADLERLLRG